MSDRAEGSGRRTPEAQRPAATAEGARLDPASVQVLFADLQEGLASSSLTNPPETLGRAAGVLARVSTILDLPMLFSVVTVGDDPPRLLPELAVYGTVANTRLRWLSGPFMDEPTAAALAGNGRRTLVVAGHSAEVVVLQTVLDAVVAGYTAYYVVDAIGSRSARTEAAAFRDMERVGAIPTSVMSLVTRLAPDFHHPPGVETFAALQALRNA